MRYILFFITACFALTNAARGQALLAFSGGNGQSLSITLNSTVSYSVTASSSNNPPIFNFQGVGNVFASNAARVLGSISYTIDGGSPFSIQNFSSGYVGGDVQATDLFATGPFFGAASAVNVGQTVTLLPGTSFTVANFAATAPANGSYPTFLSAGQGSAISGLGLAVPEPGTWAAVAAMGGLFLVVRHVRRATK